MNESRSITKGERLREEIRKYALISAYLFVCFAVVLLYDTANRGISSGDPLPWTLALIKALVMGKFILIGDALSVGKRADNHPLLHRIAWKTGAMLLLLIVFKVLEEIVVGWFHDKGVSAVFAELAEMSWVQIVAPISLMLLILIPLMTATEIYRAVGRARFRALLL